MKTSNFINLINEITGREFIINTNDDNLQTGGNFPHPFTKQNRRRFNANFQIIFPVHHCILGVISDGPEYIRHQ